MCGKEDGDDMSEECMKCHGDLYSGWHTNTPGSSLGRKADDVLCLMTGPLREEATRLGRKLAGVEADRDELKERNIVLVDGVKEAGRSYQALKAENQKLRGQDAVHWKTRRSLLNERNRLLSENAKLKRAST